MVIHQVVILGNVWMDDRSQSSDEIHKFQFVSKSSNTAILVSIKGQDRVIK